MPKSYLKSQNPPDNPVDDWLLWTPSQLESFIGDPSNKIASILGINKAGDLQYIIMPTIVPKALGDASVVLGNSTDASSEPAFVYLDMSDLGYTSVIETYALIPREIRPEESLPTKYLKGTTWETAKVPLGLACVPIVAPVFFGMRFVEANIHDSDFEEKLALLSPTHLAWAKLVKENINQQENDGKDYDKILGRISKGDEDTVSKYVTPTTFGVELLDAPIIQVFTLPRDKWKEVQEELRTFFKSNPSPVRQPRPSLTSPVSSPVVGVTFATNIRATTPVSVTNATASQQTTANNQQPFDPMSFMQQFATQMMAVQQKSQTIVVESREDKTRESEAKFNNNMLQLLLVGGTIDFVSPGSFVDPRIAKYTQAMKNILLQPTSVRSISTVNILTTVFNEIPNDMAERLSPLTTHKSMHHVSKNFASALLSCNFQRTNLDSLSYETNSITILSFVAQSDLGKVHASREAEQVAKNEREFDFVESHRKALKTTIEGLGKIHSMDCIVKICANVCCVITALFDIRAGKPVPLLYSVCIKTIEVVKHPEFIKWHSEVHDKVPQLPYIFLNMLHKVLSQLASFSTNSVNNNLVEHGDDGSKLTIILIVKIVKFATRFFSNIENHIMEGSVPDSVPNFTPRDSNPKLLQTATIMSVVSNTEPGISKVKPESSPPGTPARDRTGKKQRVKPAPGSQDFSKAGLFHCKEGTPFLDLFPANLEKKLCSFFCLHGKKCSKPTQVCEYEHIGKWEKIPANDQIKILEHCHATQGKKVWLDAETFAKHKIIIPDKYAYLLGDSKGPKGA
jgi:hypothetical protein